MNYVAESRVITNVPGEVLDTLRISAAYFIGKEYGDIYEKYLKETKEQVNTFSTSYLCDLVYRLHRLSDNFKGVFDDIIEFLQNEPILQPDTCGLLKELLENNEDLKKHLYFDEIYKQLISIYDLLDYCYKNNEVLEIKIWDW